MLYDVASMKTTTQHELAEILRDLVAIHSVEDSIQKKFECIEYAANHLASSKLTIRTGSSNGLPWVVATTQGNMNPKVLLQAHLDVVPATGEAFLLRDEGGKYLGRGVYDMKFAAACYLQLVSELAETALDYDFGIMLTTDEEIGGENGVGYLLGEGYGAGVCILPDGGDNWQLESECNGVWLVDIVASGKSAHGSRPWEGENAINKLLNCILEIQHVFPMDGDDKNTLTVSKISGGAAINQVPSEAKVTLDMRFVDDKSYISKRIAVEQCIQNAGLTLETIARVDSVTVDKDDPAISKFMEIAEECTGKPISCGRSYGASDAHYFTKAGIPTILIRPDGGGAHSENEWLDKNGFYTFYDVLKEYVRKVAILR